MEHSEWGRFGRVPLQSSRPPRVRSRGSLVSHEARARVDERVISESRLFGLFSMCSPADQPSVRTVLRLLVTRMMMCLIGCAMVDQQRSTRPTPPRCDVNTRITERMSSATRRFAVSASSHPRSRRIERCFTNRVSRETRTNLSSKYDMSSGAPRARSPASQCHIPASFSVSSLPTRNVCSLDRPRW